MSRSSRAAQLDAERRRQNEAGETGGRTHHHLRRDPAAEIGADQHTVLEAQLAGEVEIQVGHVVDAARTALDQRRRAISGMRRRDHTIVPREQLEPEPLGRQPLAGVEKQQRPSLTALDQFEAGAAQSNGPGHVTASSMRPPPIVFLLTASDRVRAAQNVHLPLGERHDLRRKPLQTFDALRNCLTAEVEDQLVHADDIAPSACDGSFLTRRWRKTDSNSQSHVDD